MLNEDELRPVLDEETKAILRDSSLTPYGKFMFASEGLKQPAWTAAYHLKLLVWALILGGLWMDQITYDFLDDTSIGGLALAFLGSLVLGSVPSAIVCIILHDLPRQRRNELITELQMIYASSRDRAESDFWTHETNQ